MIRPVALRYAPSRMDCDRYRLLTVMMVASMGRLVVERLKARVRQTEVYARAI